MSSGATIEFDPMETRVESDEWIEFCAEHGIAYSPNTVGGNIYYAGGHAGVEIEFDPRRLRFSTFHMGKACDEVARITLLAWLRWGGDLSADPEIRALISRRP